MRRIFLRKISRTRATSILEYTALLTIILVAFLFFQKYIVRGFAGRWKEAGDSLGYGRQYDPTKTVECSYSETFNKWYVEECFSSQLNSNYQSLFSACRQSCVNSGTLGPCGGAVTCPSISFWGGFSAHCCYEQCEDKCRQQAEETSVNNCESSGPISCAAE